MSRVALHLAVLVCMIPSPGHAEDARTQAQPIPATYNPALKKAPRARPKAANAENRHGAVEPIFGDPGNASGSHASIDAPRKGAKAENAWSVSPEWSAANGGTSAAYGTRALVNELQSNPAETTGYGAGAKVDFHF